MPHPIFSAGHVQDVAQIPQQRHFRIAVELARGPIHFELNHLTLLRAKSLGYNAWRDTRELSKEDRIVCCDAPVTGQRSLWIPALTGERREIGVGPEFGRGMGAGGQSTKRSFDSRWFLDELHALVSARVSYALPGFFHAERLTVHDGRCCKQSKKSNLSEAAKPYRETVPAATNSTAAF